MSDVPFLTVVTVTLNDQEGLRRTLESLNAQNHLPPYEQIVVDGGSGYDVAGLLAELGVRAVLRQGQDTGLYDAMNIGLAMARGRYVLFLNSGDEVAGPDVLAAVAAAAVKTNADFIYGDSHERQVDGKTLYYKRAQPLRRIAYGMMTHHQAMVFRRGLLRDKGIAYDPSYTIAADYDFVLRFVQASTRHAYLPRPICVFDAGGRSFLRADLGRLEQFRIRKAAYGSWLFAAFVYSAQAALWHLRARAPGLYRAVRGTRKLTPGRR